MTWTGVVTGAREVPLDQCVVTFSTGVQLSRRMLLARANLLAKNGRVRDAPPRSRSRNIAD